MSDISSMLSVQAYERLVTFADRSGFPALISRFPAGSLGANQLVDVLKGSSSQKTVDSGNLSFMLLQWLQLVVWVYF